MRSTHHINNDEEKMDASLTDPQRKFEENKNSDLVTQYIIRLENDGHLTGGRNSKKTLEAKIREQYGEEITGRYGQEALQNLSVRHSIEYDNTNRQMFELGGGIKKNEHVGRGGFGTVKIARLIAVGEDPEHFTREGWYAAKVPAKQSDKKGGLKRSAERDRTFMSSSGKEVEIMQALGHDARYLPNESRGHSADHTPGTLIMPYFSFGSLQSWLNNNEHSHEEMDRCAIAVMRAVKDFNKTGYIHFDIKPDNIMYDPASGTAVLLDFGISLRINNENETVRTLARGTSGYMHHKLFMSSMTSQPAHIGTEADMYSTAAVLKNIYRTKKNPFDRIREIKEDIGDLRDWAAGAEERIGKYFNPEVRINTQNAHVSIKANKGIPQNVLDAKEAAARMFDDFFSRFLEENISAKNNKHFNIVLDRSKEFLMKATSYKEILSEFDTSVKGFKTNLGISLTLNKDILNSCLTGLRRVGDEFKAEFDPHFEEKKADLPEIFEVKNTGNILAVLHSAHPLSDSSESQDSDMMTDEIKPFAKESAMIVSESKMEEKSEKIPEEKIIEEIKADDEPKGPGKHF